MAAAILAFRVISAVIKERSCASMFLSTLCRSIGTAPATMIEGLWKADVSIATPRGVITIAYQSRITCCVTTLSIRPGEEERLDRAVLQAERLAARMSERSSQTKFWNNSDMKGVATQSFGREGTIMNESRVWTTANRTFGIVCRKNGNNV